MTRSIQAVFEHGLLRPLEPLNLVENARVIVTIDSTSEARDGAAAPAETQTGLSDQMFESILDELASGPALPPLPADFSRADLYADHD